MWEEGASVAKQDHQHQHVDHCHTDDNRPQLTLFSKQSLVDDIDVVVGSAGHLPDADQLGVKQKGEENDAKEIKE